MKYVCTHAHEHPSGHCPVCPHAQPHEPVFTSVLLGEQCSDTGLCDVDGSNKNFIDTKCVPVDDTRKLSVYTKLVIALEILWAVLAYGYDLEEAESYVIAKMSL